VFDTNWMQIEEYLEHDDRIVLPTGSTEQHGYLSLGTDALCAERVAVDAAEPLGVPVLPVLPFGMAPYFTAYPGSMSLRLSTYIEVLRDLLDCLEMQGFRRIAVINGHGGNAPVAGMIREWLCKPRDVEMQVLFHSWFNGPKTVVAANAALQPTLQVVDPDTGIPFTGAAIAIDTEDLPLLGTNYNPGPVNLFVDSPAGTSLGTATANTPAMATR